jgi:hypothetical protein
MKFKAPLCAALIAAALAATSAGALACKGQTELLRDDFSDTGAWGKAVDSWEMSFDAVGGKLLVKSPPGNIGVMVNQGDFYPEGDFCVDVVLPTKSGDEMPEAGIGFIGKDNSWYLGTITFNGTAMIKRATGKGWLTPAPSRNFDAIKTAPDAKNTLRMTWKGPPANAGDKADSTVSFYVNDKLFRSIKVEPDDGRKIMLYFYTNGGSAQFTNLVVTK